MQIISKEERSVLPLVRELSDKLSLFDETLFPLMPPHGENAAADRARLELVRNAISIVIIPWKPVFGIVVGEYKPYYRKAPIFSEDTISEFSKYCNGEMLASLDEILEIDRQIRDTYCKEQSPR